MRFITPLFLALLLVGCGSQVRPDPGPVPIDAGYPTLEMYVDGKLYHGIAVAYKSSFNFSFEVQGYYSGELTVASKNCNFNRTYSYKDSQRIRVNLGSRDLERNCVFVATMSPSYPGEGNGVPIESLRGFFALKAKNEDRQAWSRAVKARNPARGSLNIPVGDVPKARIFMSGCGKVYDKTLAPKNGNVTVRLEDLVDQFQGFCVLDGAAMTDEHQDLLLFVAVASYGPSYVPLAIPNAQISDGKLYITAEEAATAVSLNNSYVLKNSASFPFDPSKRGQIVRAVSAKGRTVLGVWNGKAFSWMQ